MLGSLDRDQRAFSGLGASWSPTRDMLVIDNRTMLRCQSALSQSADPQTNNRPIDANHLWHVRMLRVVSRILVNSGRDQTDSP